MISLIVSTRNRAKEITKLLSSLASQTNKHFEVIIVDQSPDNLTLAASEKFSSTLNIRYFSMREQGLSRGRNFGIKQSQGDILGFPDDDCWYHENIVEKVTRFFDVAKYDVLSLPVVDPDLANKAITKFVDASGPIDLKNVWHGGVGAGIFCRKEFCDKITFDEALGVGAGTIYGSSEETDLLIRGIRAGYQIYFEKDTQIYHPLKSYNLGWAILQRTYSYASGVGRVLRKNKFDFSTRLKFFIRPAGGVLWFFLRGKPLISLSHLASFFGRLRGFLL